MTPQSSALTPLGFTREYQAYRAANLAVPFADSRLLAAARFWMRFPDALNSDSYSSFWLEDLSPLLATGYPSLEDLNPDELAEIATFLGTIDSTRVLKTLNAAGVWETAARKWLYVGDAVRALKCLNAAGLRSPNLSPSLTDAHSDAPSLPSVLIGELGQDFEPLRNWLTKFDAEWRAIRESGVTNQAICVLIERDAAGRPVRGRLRTLEAHIEQLPKDRTADEVVFGHQLCTADDPQVRGAYAALAALRNADFGMRNAESKTHANLQDRSEGSAQLRSFIPHSPRLRSGRAAFRNSHSFLRARFTFVNGANEPYGGDSLAFASFAAAYGDWWAKDLHRERRLVSSQVALTGALKDNGIAQAISENSLSRKVQRVFFSPLTYLVIPQTNRAVAESELERLHELYPNRRLRLVTVDRASDLNSDGNIMIPERVCFGEYAVRAATKYTRSSKVQVPLLATLGYLLVCLLYPKAWLGFDWNPSNARFDVAGIRVSNAEGHSLWTWEFPCSSIDSLSDWLLENLDDDPERELAVLVNTPKSSACSVSSYLYIIDHDGRKISHQSARILGEYPGDTAESTPFSAAGLSVLEFGGKKRLMTAVTDSYPARGHIRFWTANGEPTGWYVSAGFPVNIEEEHIPITEGERVCIIGSNNRMDGAAALIVLPVDSVQGCAPPYADSIYDISWIKRGSQSVYVLFPRTDLSIALGLPYSAPTRLRLDPSGSITVSVDEGGESGHTEVWYSLDIGFRVSQVRVDDYFWPRRDQLVRQGVLPEIDRTEYMDSLAAHVQYWTDTGWVRNGPLGGLRPRR